MHKVGWDGADWDGVGWDGAGRDGAGWDIGPSREGSGGDWLESDLGGMRSVGQVEVGIGWDEMG